MKERPAATGSQRAARPADDAAPEATRRLTAMSVRAAAHAAGRQLVKDAFRNGTPPQAEVDRMGAEVARAFSGALVEGVVAELRCRGFGS